MKETLTVDIIFNSEKANKEYNINGEKLNMAVEVVIKKTVENFGFPQFFKNIF